MSDVLQLKPDMLLSFWEVSLVAYKITDACISCGACVSECPTDCIAEGDPIYVIKEEDCIDCEACVAICPVNACEPA